MQFSEYQEKVFEWVTMGTGNSLVQARAGSGKTFTAMHAMNHMKGNVISMTFNKKNADELQSKIGRMGLCNCKGVTFHKEGFDNFKRSHGFVKVEFNKVQDILDSYGLSWKEKSANYFIKQAISLAKQSGFGCDDCPSITDISSWCHLVKYHDIEFDADIDFNYAIEIAQTALLDSIRQKNSVDFDDMIYLPVLGNIPLSKYDWVIIDEAQDTNVVRKIMIKRMMHENTRLMAIGDDRQAIYGFTGAENDSMNIIKRTFDCVELSLPMSYRCGTKIINAAQNIVGDIIAHPDAVEGQVTSMQFDSMIQQSNNMGLDQHTGIICRNNAPLLMTAFALIRNGIGCRIEGREIGKSLLAFTRKWKVQDLATFTLRLEKYFQRELNKDISDAKKQILEDKLETMNILVERCQQLGTHTVRALENLIINMFEVGKKDAQQSPDVVTLSSIHKAKGMEWKRVMHLGPSQFIPSKYAKQSWQLIQEENLKYIAITRAMQEYMVILDVPKPSLK